MKKALLVLLFVGLAAAALAAPKIPDGKWWKRPRIAAAIRLTPEQTAELERIFVRTKPRLIDLKAELEKREFEFQEAMEDPNAGRDAITARIEAREQARASLQKEIALMVLDMKQVLRDGQWERLTRIHREVRRRTEERRRRLREGEEDGPPERQRDRPRSDAPPEEP